MTDRLQTIQKAIDSFQMDEARRLLREEIAENPSADAYYLASQAAINHGQRVEFLEKTLELDPFHQVAHDELRNMLPPDAIQPTSFEIPTGKPKAKNKQAYPLASVSKRFAALVIDSLILAMIGGVVGGLFGFVTGGSLSDVGITEAEYMDLMIQTQMNGMVLGILVNAAYYVFFMTRTNGQTPGKKMMGLRAVKKDGTPFTWVDALLRNVIGYALSGAILIGYIWALFDKERQTWHDKIAGTVVVDEAS